MALRKSQPKHKRPTRRQRKTAALKDRQYFNRCFRLIIPGEGLYVSLKIVKYIRKNPGDWVCEGEFPDEYMLVKFDPLNPEAEHEYARSRSA